MTESQKIVSWREYYSKNTKGKKFSSVQAVREHMKRLSAEYKKMKGEGLFLK